MIKVSRIKKVNDLFELRPYLRLKTDSMKKLEKVRRWYTTLVSFLKNIYEQELKNGSR